MRPPGSPEVLREVHAVSKIRAFLCAKFRLRRFRRERRYGPAIGAQVAIDRYGFTG